MAISHRRLRVKLYAYANAGDAAKGRVKNTYVLQPSAASDQAWWGARGTPSGREQTTGAQEEHIADVIIALGTNAPVSENGVAAIGEEVFKVLAVLPRQYGADELQVRAVKIDDAEYHLVDA